MQRTKQAEMTNVIDVTRSRVVNLFKIKHLLFGNLRSTFSYSDSQDEILVGNNAEIT